MKNQPSDRVRSVFERRASLKEGTKAWGLGRTRNSMLAALIASGIALFIPAAFGQSGNDTLNYSENFDSGQAEGWSLVPGWEFVPSESGYALRGDGSGHAHIGYRSTVWFDSRFRCRIRLDADFAHVSYRDGDEGRYYLSLNADSTVLHKQINPDTFLNDLRTGPGISFGVWHDLEIDGQGTTLTVAIDGVSLFTYTDSDPIANGGLSFESFNGQFWVDDIEVYIPASMVAPPDLVWVRTGGPLGGLGYDIRVHPSNANTLLVTDAFSGVFRSTNAGVDWTPANEGITTRTGASGDAIPVFCLSFDPSSARTLWIGTQNTRGVFKSTDGGVQWVPKVNGIVESTGISFRGVAVDPNAPQTIYAAAEISSWVWAGEERRGREFDMTQGVVYKSTDDGENWEAVWRGDNLARYVLVDPRDSNLLYVSTGIFDREAANSDPTSRVAGGEGVLKSLNGGRTWVRANNGLENLYVGSLFMHPDNPDILLAGAGNIQYYESGGVYRTTNGGGSWQQTLADDIITAVEFTRSDPNIAYAGSSEAIYRSADGGQTWERMTSGDDGWGSPGVRAGFPIDIQVDPTNPDHLFVNNYGGGNFFSADGGRNWSIASRGYTGAQTRDIAVDAVAPGRVFAAARSGLFLSTDGGTDWVGRSFPPASSLEWNAVALDPSDSAHIVASNNWNGVIVESNDSGRTWALVSGTAGTKQGWRVIAFAHSDPQTVYAGTSAYMSAGIFDDLLPASGIYVSHNNGSSWTAANDATSADANVIAIAVSPENARVLYAATGNHGVLKTVDGGGDWVTVNQGLPGSPVAVAVAIHPANPETVFAGLDAGGLYRSDDGGATWRQSVTGMNPQAGVSDIVFDPANPQTLFASDRSSGVYRSIDAGGTWARVTNGLRTRAVNALAISSDGKHLYAATEGEGVFRLDVDGVPPPTSEIADDNTNGTPTGDVAVDDGGTNGDVVNDNTVVDSQPDVDTGSSGNAGGGCGVGMILLVGCLPWFLLWKSRRR